MNALNQNPYSEMIYHFLDGNIDDVQQNVLFDALADNQDLQNEFRQALEISKGFQIDKKAITLPANLTNSVFQSAGFALPMQFAENKTNSSAFLNKLKPISLPVISAIIGALLTTAFFFAVNNPFGSQINSNNQIAKANIPIHNFEIPIIKSYDKSNKVFNNNKNIFKNNIVKDNQINAQINKNNNLGNLSLTEAIQSNNFIIPVIANTSFNSYQTSSEITDYVDTDVNSLNLSLELKGISGLAYFPQRKIEPEAFSLTNNLAIGLMYQFDNHNSGGISLGQESLQMYSFDKIGDKYLFNLEPNLIWVGLNYRFTGNEIYGSIYPFGELIAAGTKFGPMGKAIIGLNYNPENFFSMSLGLEGTSLLYQFMNKTKSTEKLSIVYNFGFHF